MFRIDLEIQDFRFGANLDDEKWLVWNIESLYKDLPFLVSQVKKENDKQQNMYGDLLRDSLKENER